MKSASPFPLSQPSINAQSSQAHHARVHALDRAPPSMSQTSSGQRPAGLGKRMAQDDFAASSMAAKAARTGMGSRISIQQPLVRNNAEAEQEPQMLQTKHVAPRDAVIPPAQQEGSIAFDAAIMVDQDAVADAQVEAHQADDHAAAAEAAEAAEATLPHDIQLSPATLHLPEFSSLASPDFNSSIVGLPTQEVNQETDSQLEGEADAGQGQDGEPSLVSVALLPNDDSDLLAEQWVRISIGPRKVMVAGVDSVDESATNEESQLEQNKDESEGESHLSLPATS